MFSRFEINIVAVPVNILTFIHTDTKRPLVGQLQDNTGTIALPANHASSAIVDVSENMRAKLYALFCKLGFIELPGLTTEDHVTLTIIEHYLEFKVSD